MLTLLTFGSRGYHTSVSNTRTDEHPLFTLLFSLSTLNV